jgi:hypothetical protein
MLNYIQHDLSFHEYSSILVINKQFELINTPPHLFYWIWKILKILKSSLYL